MIKKARYMDTYKIPQKFVLLGTTWKVKTSKEFIKHGGDVAAGTVDYGKKLITLKKGWRDVHKVLFHEISHILNYLTSIGTEECSSEVFADISSLFWCQVFQQMPLISSVKVSDLKVKQKRPGGKNGSNRKKVTKRTKSK